MKRKILQNFLFRSLIFYYLYMSFDDKCTFIRGIIMTYSRVYNFMRLYSCRFYIFNCFTIKLSMFNGLLL